MGRTFHRRAIVALFLFTSVPASAVPANPQEILLEQPDGTRFAARVRGDEFFSWYETTDGHPVEWDPDTEEWVYRADPNAPDAAAAGPRVVGRDAPPVGTWTPAETAEEALVREAAERARAAALQDAAAQPQPAGGGLQMQTMGIQPMTLAAGPQEKKLLTICVRFTDSPAAADLTPVGYFQDLIYTITSDPALPKRTVADYYLEVSGNKLLVSGEARGWVGLPLPKADYGGNSDKSRRYRDLVRDTVTRLGDQGFDFGPFDSDNDGFVDMIAIVFEGLGEADGGDQDSVWPHQWSYDSSLREAVPGTPRLSTGDTNAEGEEVFVDLYFTSPELNRSSADNTKKVRAPIGTFCHEFAHALGLPDLYDRTDPQSSGLGAWSLMALGTYNQANGQAGDCPAWPDPYCRMLMGWDKPVQVTSNTLRARIPEAKGPERKVLRLWNAGQSADQYFLVESRRRTGFDRGLPGEGLLVYHVSVNENTLKSQNDEQWYLQPRPWTGKGHFLVALEQADGKFDLEQSSRNPGDANDPFTTGKEFTDGTMPGSKAYPAWGQLGEGPATHVALRNIDTSQADASYADLFVFEDQQRPVAAVTAPSDNWPAVGELTKATGTAFDNVAVSRLRAWLYEAGPGGRYYDWSSGQWVADFGGTTIREMTPSNDWELPLPDAVFADKSYRLTVVASDATGLESEWAAVQFTIDRALLSPALAISSPEGETYPQPPLVAGSASSPDGTTLTERRFALYSESAAAWYRWAEGGFGGTTFDFAAHAKRVTGAESTWQFALPPDLPDGRHQIHAQSVNDRDRGSAWTYRAFTVSRKPTVSIDSIAHQALRNSLGAISGTANPQQGATLQELRVTIYLNGKYWNGSAWVAEQTSVAVSVPPPGGAWNYAGTLPADDGLYAVSAYAVDNRGVVSGPVGGGNPGQNNIVFRVDSKPPSLSVEWPSEGYVSTERSIDAAEITGAATDASGRPAVRARVKRLSDGLYWSRFGWVASDADSWRACPFPGEDGGSQSQWSLEGPLPESGIDISWCMPNGDYELFVEARDLIGNLAAVTRRFSVQYSDPLLSGAVEPPVLPLRPPVGPAVSSIGSSLFGEIAYGAGEGPYEGHSVSTLTAGKYGIVASRRKSLGYDWTREPFFLTLAAGGALWSVSLNGSISSFPVPGGAEFFYQRSPDPPTVAFGQDGSAVSASGLVRYDFSASKYVTINQCEVVKTGADGSEPWSQLVPPPEATAWQGSTASSSLTPEALRVLPDGRVVMVAALEAFGVRQFVGQTNFRNHLMVFMFSENGAVEWKSRYGEESEDERLHVNETFLLMEPDGLGNLYLGCRRVTPVGPELVLRKIRLGDGAVLAEHTSDICHAAESWGALTFDTDGRALIAGAMRFAGDDARLSLRCLNAETLAIEWRAFGPARSSNYDQTWGAPADIPLLEADANGISVVHNSPGTNGQFNDGNDRIMVTRFDASGAHRWTREVDAPAAMAFSAGSRADFGAVTVDGDVLLTGNFATGGANWVRCFAKVSGNGDLQFVKKLSDEFDLSHGTFLAATLSHDGRKLALFHLNKDQTKVQVRLMDNPANGVDAGAAEIVVEEGGSGLVNGQPLSFGSVEAGTQGELKTILVRNTGNADLTGMDVTVDGTHALDFQLTLPADGTVPPGESASFTLRFAPSGQGVRTATLRIASNDEDENPFEIALIGSGTAPTTGAPEIQVLGPASEDLVSGAASSAQVFAATQLGRTAPVRQLTLRNTGSNALGPLSVTVTGSHPDDFTPAPLSVAGLNPGESTALRVTFGPLGTGNRSAVLLVSSNDADESPFVIPLGGVGTLPAPDIDVQQPAKSSLVDNRSKRNFGAVKLGKTKRITFTVRNVGGSRLGNLAVSSAGKHPKAFLASAPKETSLEPGASTTFTVTFDPSAKRSLSAVIRVKSNDPDENPFEIPVSGLGVK